MHGGIKYSCLFKLKKNSFCIVHHKTCQSLEALHNSMKQFFPNDQKESFNLEYNLIDFNLTIQKVH